MAEKKILQLSAHVFKIDDDKKSWKELGKGSIPVAVLHDENRNTYRVVAMDGQSAVINSLIQPDMKFTKTSAKFGQWTDAYASTVYGIGVGSEEVLAQFQSGFETGIRARPKPTPSPKQRQNSGDRAGGADVASAAGAAAPSSDVLAQLKYENERLKIALGTSATNAKRWEQELQTLKNNNARLKTALQESASNVEEWKTQLTAWKEECIRLRAQVKELRASGGSEAAAEAETLKDELSRLRGRISSLEAEKSALETQTMAASGGKRQMADQIGVLGGQFASKLAELNALQAQLTRIADN
eukprot:m.414893 g.414893  ORF g.414893 m.414893 type:complete len:300 (-) comp29462_c0_seq1:56-955(-)